MRFARFLDCVRAADVVKSFELKLIASMTAPHDNTLWLDRARRPHLSLLLDFDGTLIPFAETLEQAVLDDRGAALLRALVASGISVSIVSGRPLPALERERLRVPEAWWVAEHGTWNHFGTSWESHAVEVATELHALLDAMRSMSVPGIRFEQKSQSICVHWRQVATPLRESAITDLAFACDAWLQTHPQYERLDGVEMIEVRERSAHKGSAVKRIRERVPGAMFIAIGDDDTDEDMFVALAPDDVAIRVRNGRRRPTRARYSLANPGAVHELLWWVVAARTHTGLVPLPRFDAARSAPSITRAPLAVLANRPPTEPAAE